MLRPAVPAELPRLLALRDTASADALSDPALVAEADLRRLVGDGLVTVWGEDGRIAGFAATDNGAIHLLVDSSARGKGIGRDLLAAACTRLKEAGRAVGTLGLAPDSTAVRHYLAAGWTVARETPDGRRVLQKPL